MVALVHCELVLTLLVGVFDDLVHGYLIPNGRRGVGVHVVQIYLSGVGLSLTLHVILTASGSSATRVRVDTTDSLLILGDGTRASALVLLRHRVLLPTNRLKVRQSFSLGNIDSTSFALIIIFKTTLSSNRCQKRVRSTSLAQVDIIIVIRLIWQAGLVFGLFYDIRRSTLRKIEILLHIWARHLRRL